jgi:glycosyltransferase involved in cell wall biosynthesis
LPDAAAVLVQDPRIRRLIQPCDWAADLYRRECGSKMMVWPVGIDTEMWEDMHGLPKDLDVVIYDKIRWDRETEVPRVLDRIKQGLRSAGLSFETIRYGHHHLSQFSGLLRRARAMVFVCEHETQGLACQEAMACNVPVLAWDEGVLVDPWQKKFAAPDLRVSSVPYFDGRCGERFQIADFEAVLAKFWSRLDSYQPRRFVEEELSLAQSAQSYLAAYGALLPRSPA